LHEVYIHVGMSYFQQFNHLMEGKPNPLESFEMSQKHFERKTLKKALKSVFRITSLFHLSKSSLDHIKYKMVRCSQTGTSLLTGMHEHNLSMNR